MGEEFGVWLTIDIFVRILTMLTVVTLLSKSIKGFMLFFMILIFLLWVFRPLYLAFKEFLKKESPLRITNYFRLLAFKNSWFFLAGGIIGVLFFLYFLSLSLTYKGLFLVYYITGVIASFILLFTIGLVSSNLLMKGCSLIKIRKHLNNKNPEIAVILGYDGPKVIGNLFISTYLGIGYLVKYLELKKKSFNIYITPSKNEFNNLLKNKRIKIFYLVGHGSKRGFCLNKRENVFYSDYLNNSIIKDEIHLYHCGHSEGKTLIDYFVKKENRKKCFVANDKVLVISYILRFYDLYKLELQKHKKGSPQ